MPQQYIIPEWMRESLSAEELARLEATATAAAFKGVAADLEALATASAGAASAAAGGHRDTAVTLLTEARRAASDALVKLGAPPVVVVSRPATAARSGEAADGAKVVLTEEQLAKKKRSSACWYFIRNACGDRYVDPADMKAKNPEAYRQLYAQAAALWDEGRLSPSGKPL